MDTRSSESPNLPPGWQASPGPSGGVELRVEARGRRRLAAVVGVLAVVACWRSYANWQTASLAPWLGITLALSLFAVWCTFADELWRIEPNHIVHRVGIGPWAYSRHYRDAELQITVGFSRNFNVPYYRLFAVENGRPQFLLERGEQELPQLAAFMSHHTGWPIRPVAPPLPGFRPF